MPIRHQSRAIVQRIAEQGLPLLAEIVWAGDRASAHERIAQPRQYQRNENDDNGDDHQQLYEGETAPGVKLPDELGFAVLDRSPGITTASGVDQQMEEVGAAAVEQLVGLIRRGDRGAPKHPRTVLIEPRWVDGDTTRKIKGGAPSSSPRPRGGQRGRRWRAAESAPGVGKPS